jgi:transposase
MGKTPREVAELLVVSLATVYNWRKRWQTGQLDALTNRPKSGRPGIADERYCQILEATLSVEPCDLGYDFSIWTVDRLRAHLERETGKSISPGRFRALLKREGYRYRRPKYDLGHLQDREAKAKAQELLEELKRGRAKTVTNSSLWTKQA